MPIQRVRLTIVCTILVMGRFQFLINYSSEQGVIHGTPLNFVVSLNAAYVFDQLF